MIQLFMFLVPCTGVQGLLVVEKTSFFWVATTNFEDVRSRKVLPHRTFSGTLVVTFNHGSAQEIPVGPGDFGGKIMRDGGEGGEGEEPLMA